MQNSGTLSTLYGIVFIENAGAPLVAVGENGTILRTSNKGATWTPIQSGTVATLYGVTDDHVVGDSGIILRTSDVGLTWIRVPAVTLQRLRGVSRSTSGLACGDSGVILRRFSDVSNVWNVMPSGTTATLFGIPLFANNNLVVGDSGLILRSTDYGTTWSRQASGTVARLHDAQFPTALYDVIYCVGDGGVVLKSTNHGATWGRQQSGTTRNLQSVFFYIFNDFGWVAGDSGTILRTTDGGGPITDVNHSDPHIPAVASLRQNFPNPFNPTTTIEFSLPHTSFVRLGVFDISGEEVATLVSQNLPAGIHHATWNAQGSPSGIYFYRLQTNSFTETKKLLLVR
jgi:photosystem II stability/assembly factor-like uncharacterized protein